MTNDERLHQILEEQRLLRERLTRLDATIAVLRSDLRQEVEKRAAQTSVTPPIAASPAAVTEPLETSLVPPPLPPLPSKVITPAPAEVAAVKVAPLQVDVSSSARPLEQKAAPLVKAPLQTSVPQTSAPPVPAKKGDFEMRLGQVWFVRIGIVAILTGLVLASIYAYSKFAHNTPPSVKVLALYAVSGLLAGAGIWLQRAREKLQAFGKVLTAGGLAAVYYTTYALHYVDRLRIVESPVIGGILLLLCALGIFAYADRKKDQTVAAMSLVLGYYGTAINAVGWFSLFSNLILTLGGIWLLWRHRWVALGALSLAGSYGGFAFWQYALPLITTGQLAPIHYWAGQGFLIGCWVLFSAAFVLAKTDVIKMPQRASLAATNNGAFFGLFTIALLARTPELQRTDAFAIYAFVWGTFLLALCWLSERLHGEKGRPLGETFLACGLIEIALGFAIKLSGYDLATVFAFKAALLAWLGMKQDRIVAKVASALLAGAVICLPFREWVAFTEGVESWTKTLSVGQQISVWLQTSLLLLAGWFLRGRKVEPTLEGRNLQTSPTFSGLSLWLCLAAFFSWSWKIPLPLTGWTDFALFLGFAAALLGLGDRQVLAFREVRYTGSIAGLLGVLLIAAQSISDQFRVVAPWTLTSSSVSILALMLLGLAWLTKRNAWLSLTFSGREFSIEAFLHSFVALLSWSLVVLMPLDEWWEPTVLLMICGVLSLLGRIQKVGLPELSFVARIGGIGSAAAIVWFAFWNQESLTTWNIVGALLNTILLGVAAWLGRHHPTYERRADDHGFSWVAFYYSLGAAASFVLIVFLPMQRDWQPAFWVLFCAILILIGKLRAVNLAELSIVSGLVALGVTVYEWSVMNGPAYRNADLWLLLAFSGLAAAAARKADVWTCDAFWLKALRWAAGIQATLSYLHWWHAHAPEYFPLATIGAAFVLAILTRWRPSPITAIFAFIMLGLGLTSFLWDSFFGRFSYQEPVKWWSWLVPLLAMASEWLLRKCDVFTTAKRGLVCNVFAVAAVLTLWVFVTWHVLPENSFRTMAWAAMALTLFVVGLGLRHPLYRRCGLALLALALGRIVFYDVWQLDTAARFASFLVIGVVLVALGFFYNRFEEIIRKYL